MTLLSGTSTESLALSNAAGRSIISYNGLVTVMLALAGNLQRILEMSRIWLMSFTIQGNLDDDQTSRSAIGPLLSGFTISYFLMDLRPVSMVLGWVFTTYH